MAKRKPRVRTRYEHSKQHLIDECNRLEVRAPLCKLPSCRNRRMRLSAWCKVHFGRLKRTGSPVGYLVRERNFKPYREKTRKFLQEHLKHPGTQGAMRYIGALLSLGVRNAPRKVDGQTSPANRLNYWCFKLRQYEISPLDILTEVMTWYLAKHQMPFLFHMGLSTDRKVFPPNIDEQVFRRQMARSVLRLMPVERRPKFLDEGGVKFVKSGLREYPQSPQTLDMLAKRLCNALGTFCLRAADHIEQYWADPEDVHPVYGTWEPFDNDYGDDDDDDDDDDDKETVEEDDDGQQGSVGRGTQAEEPKLLPQDAGATGGGTRLRQGDETDS